MRKQMRTVLELPAGYEQIEEIDLQKDKRLMFLVNGAALGILAVLGVLGNLAVPIGTLYDAGAGIGAMLLRIGVLLAGIVCYIALHELVHGVFIRRYSGRPASYGFTGVYACAGSAAYFAKRDYFVIALAPVVLWGAVLAVMAPLVPRSWFWVVYFIQLVNLSGAAGDLYVVWHFRKLPPSILVQDRGVSMAVYAPAHEGK